LKVALNTIVHNPNPLYYSSSSDIDGNTKYVIGKVTLMRIEGINSLA